MSITIAINVFANRSLRGKDGYVIKGNKVMINRWLEYRHGCMLSPCARQTFEKTNANMRY